MTTGAAELFWWVALPYFALGVVIVGHVWRWRYDQFGWTSRSTQLQERRLLKWGSPLFHYGTFAAIGGYVIGVLVPERWTKAVGISEGVYRWFSAGAGTLAAVLVIGGVVVLATQRLFVPRVRATTAPIDCLRWSGCSWSSSPASPPPSVSTCSGMAMTTEARSRPGSAGCSASNRSRGRSPTRPSSTSCTRRWRG